jgi:acyl-CoA thioesterase
VQAIALAAHAAPQATGGFEHARMPKVPGPEHLEIRNIVDAPPMHARYEQRVALGPAQRGGPQQRQAVTGGWIRPSEPRGWDPTLICAVADAWIPAVFAAEDMPETSAGVPTIDLSVHILAPDLISELGVDDYVLVRFETQTVRRGYLEEDGEIFSPSGRILARARQVAVVL